MGKDPAFLFYPGDWLGGTLGMTFEEKGAYMELLMLQFNRGHMTEHMIGQTVGQLWVKIQDKFIQDDKGLYYNVRLQDEIIKRQRFIESRVNNVSGKNQYSKDGGHMGGHVTPHMENENRNVNKDKNKYADYVSMTEDQFKKLTERFGEHNTKIMIEILNNYKGSKGKKYKDDYLAILNWVVDRAKQDGKFRTL